MGCRPFPPHVSPTFVLSRAFLASPTTSRPQRRARDRGKRGDDVAKENNLLLEISTDRAKRQSISSPATTESRGFLLFGLFWYSALSGCLARYQTGE